MKRLLYIFSMIFAAVTGVAAQTTDVHFIGNSFTSTFDVPAVVEALSASGGHTVQTTTDIIGGAKLELHWSTGTATNSIANGNFDYVVLQENSELFYDSAIETNYNIYAPLFDQEIINSGAQTMLYMTWTRESRIASLDHGITIHRDRAEQLGSQIAPAGEAWRRLLEQSIYIDPYSGDRHHQSEADPYQMNNLADDPDYAEVKAHLRHELNAWLAKAEDPYLPEELRGLPLQERIGHQNKYYTLLAHKEDWDQYVADAVTPYVKVATPVREQQIRSLASQIFDADFFGHYKALDLEVNKRRRSTRPPDEVRKELVEYEKKYAERLEIEIDKIKG